MARDHLEELITASGVPEPVIRFRLVPQLIAFAVYQHFWLLCGLNPAWSHRLNADIEDHAEYEYAALVAEHRNGRTSPSSRRWPRSTGRSSRSPTCSARSAATRACTKRSASPVWTTPAAGPARYGLRSRAGPVQTEGERSDGQCEADGDGQPEP